MQTLQTAFSPTSESHICFLLLSFSIPPFLPPASLHASPPQASEMEVLKVSAATMLEDEISWLDNFEPSWSSEMETSEADNILLAGHLRLIKTLLSLCGNEKEHLGEQTLSIHAYPHLSNVYSILFRTQLLCNVVTFCPGPSLIQQLLDDFLFRASRIIINSSNPTTSPAPSHDFHPKYVFLSFQLVSFFLCSNPTFHFLRCDFENLFVISYKRDLLFCLFVCFK